VRERVLGFGLALSRNESIGTLAAIADGLPNRRGQL